MSTSTTLSLWQQRIGDATRSLFSHIFGVDAELEAQSKGVSGQFVAVTEKMGNMNGVTKLNRSSNERNPVRFTKAVFAPSATQNPD